MAWWHEVLGLEVTLGISPPPQGQPKKQEEAGLVQQAITKYVGVSAAGTGGSWAMRVAVDLGMLPSAEEYREQMRKVPSNPVARAAWAATNARESIPTMITRAMWGRDIEIDKQLQTELKPFVRGVQSTVAEANRKRSDYNIVLQLGKELFGPTGSQQLLEAERIAQQESGPIRDVEKQFAQRLILEHRTKGNINPMGWIARQSRELLYGVVAQGGVQQVGREEYGKLQGYMDQIDPSEGLEIATVTLRNAFWASIFQRDKHFNPELLLGGGGITIAVTRDGQVIRKIGYESKEIAKNAKDLIVQTDQPDWVEATRSMVEGRMQIPGATAFVQGQMKKGDDPKHYYRDVGKVILGRTGASGKETQIEMPTISVSRTVATIKAGLDAVGLTSARLTDLRKEIPAINESDDGFREDVVETLSEAVLHKMPRSRIVLDEARRIESATRDMDTRENMLLQRAGLPTVMSAQLANAISSQGEDYRNRAVLMLSEKLGNSSQAEEAMLVLEGRARRVLGDL